MLECCSFLAETFKGGLKNSSHRQIVLFQNSLTNNITTRPDPTYRKDLCRCHKTFLYVPLLTYLVCYSYCYAMVTHHILHLYCVSILLFLIVLTTIGKVFVDVQDFFKCQKYTQKRSSTTGSRCL